MDQGREEQEFWKAHERLKGGGSGSVESSPAQGCLAKTQAYPRQFTRQFTRLPFPDVTHLVDVVA